MIDYAKLLLLPRLLYFWSGCRTKTKTLQIWNDAEFYFFSACGGGVRLVSFGGRENCALAFQNQETLV